MAQVQQDHMVNSVEEFLNILDSDEELGTNESRLCHAPDNVWRQIIIEHPELKRWVAWNKTISYTILEILSEDNDPEIRWWIASKTKISIGLLERFSKDSNSSIRERIVFNSFTPVHILKELSLDTDADIAENARRRLIERNAT